MAALFDLKGKTVLVTGGTKGIGQSMTIAIAEAGADVISLQVRSILDACLGLSVLSQLDSEI